MTVFITELLLEVLKKLLTSVVTEKFLAELTLHALRKLAKSTNNTVDDSVVAIVEKALQKAAE